MAANSKIEWCNNTLNLWWGCTSVHTGCNHCYAETLAKRWGKNLWGNDVPRLRIKSAWSDLDKFQKVAFAANQYHTVFVGSMMDIAEKSMPLSNPIDHYTTTDDLRQELFSRIIAGLYPNLIFLFLTKRPSNIPKYFPAGWLEKPAFNIWFGTSPVDQPTYDTLKKQLMQIKANTFLSIEPQLGDIYLGINDPPKWIIQGGESGHYKRPFDINWAHSIRAQCKLLRVPYFFKQIDKVQPIPQNLLIRQFPWG